jgi:predicted DNA-binding transcriptional regulator AlpA
MKGVMPMTQTMTEQGSRWLTVDEVCTELRIARSTWEKWRQKNAGPKVVKLPNGQLRIRRDWLDAWINERLPIGV